MALHICRLCAKEAHPTWNVYFSVHSSCFSTANFSHFLCLGLLCVFLFFLQFIVLRTIRLSWPCSICFDTIKKKISVWSLFLGFAVQIWPNPPVGHHCSNLTAHIAPDLQKFLAAASLLVGKGYIYSVRRTFSASLPCLLKSSFPWLFSSLSYSWSLYHIVWLLNCSLLYLLEWRGVHLVTQN